MPLHLEKDTRPPCMEWVLLTPLPSLNLGLRASQAWNEEKCKEGTFVEQATVKRGEGSFDGPTTRAITSHVLVHECTSQRTCRSYRCRIENRDPQLQYGSFHRVRACLLLTAHYRAIIAKEILVLPEYKKRRALSCFAQGNPIGKRRKNTTVIRCMPCFVG